MYATVVVADSKMGHGWNAYSPNWCILWRSSGGAAAIVKLLDHHHRTIFMEDRVEGSASEGSPVNSNRKGPDNHPVLITTNMGPSIFKLLPGKDQPLLVWWNPLLVLDFGLDIVNCVRALNFQGYGLPSEGLHKDLHTTTEAKNQVEGGLLLNVVIS
ncbi:hypothetical protein NC652_019666 [Populus alba x Populus x berolinensis]|nr:hypothetical protein NC652_019666 [Populus alba x Populus x berolinensis]